jgi:hypothetical protein
MRKLTAVAALAAAAVAAVVTVQLHRLGRGRLHRHSCEPAERRLGLPAGCCDSPVVAAGDTDIDPTWRGGVYGGGLVPAVVVVNRGGKTGGYVSQTPVQPLLAARDDREVRNLPSLAYAADTAQVTPMTEFFTPKGKGDRPRGLEHRLRQSSNPRAAESGRFSRPGPVSIYRVPHDRVTASSRPCHHGESHEVARSGEALPARAAEGSTADKGGG